MFEESVTTPSIWASMNSWFTPTVFFVLLNVMIGTIAIASSLTNQKHPRQDQDEQQRPHLPRSPSVLQRLRSINFYSHRSQEPQSVFPRFELPPQTSHAHYPSQQTHLLQTLETRTGFVFPETHEQEAPETQNHFVSEVTRQEESHRAEIQYHFEDIRQPETLMKDNRGFVEQEIPLKDNDGFVEQEQEEEGESEEPRSLDEVYSQLADRRIKSTKTDTKPASGENPVRSPAKFRKSASSKSAFGHLEEVDNVEARRPATMKEGKAKMTEEDDEVDARADDFINRFKQQLKLQRLDSITRKAGERFGN